MINPDELLFTVDEDNNPIEPKPRDFVHRNGYWHRTSHVWIINDQKQILCQQRSMLKEQAAGCWDPFFAGHLQPEMTNLDCAIAELEEEIGLIVPASQLKELFTFKRDNGKEFQTVYKFIWNNDLSILKLEKDEVDQVRWYSLDDIKRKYILNPEIWRIMGYEQKLFSLLFK
jgi:isopentenyldiphosphate isomerase